MGFLKILKKRRKHYFFKIMIYGKDIHFLLKLKEKKQKHKLFLL